MKSIKVSARNVQKAIDNALKELNLKQEDVDIKIIDEGGLFRKAKVEIFYDESKVIDDKISEEINKDSTKKVEDKVEDLTDDKKVKADKKPKNENACNNDALKEFAGAFLSKLFELFEVKVEINCEIKDDEYFFVAQGEKLSKIIGCRGETMNAIQEVLKNYVRNNGYTQKVYFSAGNYKDIRETALIELAKRTAKKALRIGKPIRLEPMNSYDRKVVHTALQNYDGVITQSEGKEPHRRVIVIPKK